MKARPRLTSVLKEKNGLHGLSLAVYHLIRFLSTFP